MTVELDAATPRPLWPALRRGFARTCPCCGVGKLYHAYLKVEPVCAHCGTALHHQRADDAPPYFTMFVVGHIVIGLLLVVERKYMPAIWIHLALWLPLTAGLSLWLLPRIKGALIGVQWALRMHGFGVPVAGIDTAETWAGDEVQSRRAELRP